MEKGTPIVTWRFMARLALVGALVVVLLSFLTGVMGLRWTGARSTTLLLTAAGAFLFGTWIYLEEMRRRWHR
ncbi:MAG: hypothetical protein HYU86_05455 [Chloroflexi bacterium]|nr:hypothetical protein [Chloroflexota bacterium]